MRPTLQMLTPEAVERVIEEALVTLQRVGVLVEHEAARTLLQDAGAQPDSAAGSPPRLLLDEPLVRQALQTVPHVITLYDRQGERPLSLGGDSVCFDPGSAALHVLDPLTRRRRQVRVQDCVNLAWVTEACGNIGAQSTGLVPSDVPHHLADRYRLYLALQNSRKPVVTGTFVKEAFSEMRDMLVAVRGTEQALRDRPLAIFDCCPTPPLKWSDLTCQALMDSARAGIPAQLVSMPMAGATSPVTLREVVVQHTAENLCGVVIHQLTAAGAPIIHGGSPSALDMRHGTTPMGAIETQMVEVACAQVGKRLGLPTHAYMALSDAKGVDWQAGLESGVGAVLAALGGINMVSGPGMLDFEICQSLEKLVLDNEACGMALRLVRGIDDAPGDQTAPELIRQVVQSGHFLAHPHTRAHFRQELYLPSVVIDRQSYGDWEQRGAPSAWDAAADQVTKILGRGNPCPVEASVKHELDAVVSRHPELPLTP